VAEDWGHVFNGEANIDRWSPRVAEVLRDQGITKLRIREGWQEPGLDPLVPFGDQITRIFVECDVADLSSLGGLSRLRDLSLRGGMDTIDFSRLQRLETLRVSADSPHFGNVHECQSLRVLGIINCGLRDVAPLSALGHLAELEISEAPLKTLAGVDGLRSLRRLGLFQVPLETLEGLSRVAGLLQLVLYSVRRLQSIAELTRLTTLSALDIDDSKKITDLERVGEMSSLEDLTLTGVPLPGVGFLSRLTGLRNLVLNDAGKIPSLSFLRGLDALESFVPGGSTVVVDGDMSVLLDLPKLNWVTFTERRHYTHTSDQVRATLVARWTRGPGSFDNAMAWRWSEYLWERNAVSWLGNSVGEVLRYGSQQDVPPMAGQYAVAAAELVAILKGRGEAEARYPEPLTRWLAQSALDPPPWLVANATAALDRLLVPPSGLLRLWQERGQLALWEAALADLRTRLTS